MNHNHLLPTAASTALSEQVNRILVVDDDPAILTLVNTTLSSRYLLEQAFSAEQAQAMLAEDGPFDLLLSDVRLEGMGGIELLRYVKLNHPMMSTIVMSGAQQMEDVVLALRARADDFLSKPFSLNDLVDSVQNVLDMRSQPDKIKEYGWNSASEALVRALSAKDNETDGHASRVVQFSLRLGEEMGLARADMLSLKLGSRLHDIGKIGIPDQILRKPGALTDDEKEKMRTHATLGQNLLRNLDLPEGAARVVGQHHEKWDGTGYPNKLAGNEIDLAARIFSVIDAFDAIISDRCYRMGRSYEEAVKELQAHSGTQFDPQVVEAFMRVPQSDWENLKNNCRTDDCRLASI